jgi:hypothetical protein
MLHKAKARLMTVTHKSAMTNEATHTDCEP